VIAPTPVNLAWLEVHKLVISFAPLDTDKNDLLRLEELAASNSDIVEKQRRKVDADGDRGSVSRN
jgi:hypothetical protein